MNGYLDSLDFAQSLVEPKRVLEKRRAWNRQGYLYTARLLSSLERASLAEDKWTLIALLGGTHDDRAAVALRNMLSGPVGAERKWHIYAALAELGYYSRHYARLLLDEVLRGWEGPGGNRKWDCAILLATIHRPEAVWVQNQLYEQHLVDGGLSETVGPLLRFRDLALHLKHVH